MSIYRDPRLNRSFASTCVQMLGDAWLELLAGRKRWAIYSMAEVGTPPGGYAEARPHGAWQQEVYPDLVAGKERGPLPLECIQQPGEVVYVRQMQCLS
jgi:hypothetical protein